MPEVIPNLHPAQKFVQMYSPQGKSENLRVQTDSAPLSIPDNLSWNSLPQGWESLRYAQAAVPRAPDLYPPAINLMPEGSRNGAQYGDEIGLTPSAMNASAFPYTAPSSVPLSMMRKTGTLPHELTHYLSEFAAKRKRMSPEELARLQFEKIGTYQPMYAQNAPNADENYHERLANRVGIAYADAQIVGQKAGPLLEQARPISILPSWMMQQFNNRG